MRGSVCKPNCKCPDKKKCTCKATWGYIVDNGKKPNGKRNQIKKCGFRKRSDAETALAKVIDEITEKRYVKESNMLFKDFAIQWLDHYAVTNGVKEGTLRIRRNEISHLKKDFELIPINEIKKRDYQMSLNRMKKEVYSHNTISGVHTTAGMIFSLAVEWGMIKKENDPTEGAKVPKDKATVEQLENETKLPKYLEKEELDKFLKTAQRYGLEDDYEIFRTLSYSGVRVGEMCAFKDRDLIAGTEEDLPILKVTKTLYNPNNNRFKYEITTPKTPGSVRDIPVDTILFDLLTKLISKRKVIKMKYRKTYHDKGFIFAYSKENAAGYPFYIKFVENRMTRLLKLAGLPQELTPHSLRHTHCSLLAEAGVSLEEIMDRLGHEDDDTTKLIYLHVTKAKKKEAAQKFNALMSGIIQ
jgi:integrase